MKQIRMIMVMSIMMMFAMFSLQGCESKKKLSDDGKEDTEYQTGVSQKEQEQIESTWVPIKPTYGVYGILSGAKNIAFTDEDYKNLAMSFSLVHSDFTTEQIDKMHSINPDFIILKYMNSASTGSGESIPIVEKNYRNDIAYYLATSLKSGISENDTTFLLEGSEAAFKASTTDFDYSGTVSCKRYVTWIKIDNEFMKITGWDNNSKMITVKREFGGTEAVAHSSGAKIFAPAYRQGQHPDSDSKFLRYMFDPGKPLAARYMYDYEISNQIDTLKALEAHYDGSWYDIFTGYSRKICDMNGVRIDNQLPWNFATDKPYTNIEFTEAQNQRLNEIQNSVYEKAGKYPIIFMNNLTNHYWPGNSNCKSFLQSTKDKSRPADGYCKESFVGGGEDAGSGIVIHSYDKWKEHMQLVMDAAQDGLPVYPSMINAGADSPILEKAPADKRNKLEMFGFASYLLCYEPDAPMCLGMTPCYIDDNDRRYIKLHERYAWDIGLPTEKHIPTDVDKYMIPETFIYIRKYSDGLVLVNPTKEESTIQLEGTYLDLETGDKVTTISMAGQTGKILKQTSEQE